MTDTSARQFGPGTFGCHEALDRSALIVGILDDLSNHPAVRLVPDWGNRVERALHEMQSLYDEIARVHLPADDMPQE